MIWGSIWLVKTTKKIKLPRLIKWADEVLVDWSKGQKYPISKTNYYLQIFICIFLWNIKKNRENKMSLQKWMKVDHMMAAGLFSLVILGLVVPRKLLIYFWQIDAMCWRQFWHSAALTWHKNVALKFKLYDHYSNNSPSLGHFWFNDSKDQRLLLLKLSSGLLFSLLLRF